jgi:hypothetical protein
MTSSSAGPAPPTPAPSKHSEHRWVWVVVCCFGAFAFVPFLWAAVQVRTRNFWNAAIVSCVGSAASWVALSTGGLFAAADQRDALKAAGVPAEVVDQTGISGATWAYVVLFAAWGGTSLYALYLNPEYLSWRRFRREGYHPAQAAAPTEWSPGGSRRDSSSPPIREQKRRAVPLVNWRGTVNVHEQVVNAGGDVSGVHAGTVSQQGSVSGLQVEAVVALMAQYRAALIEMDPSSRQQAELALANLESEISLPQPDTTVASRQLEVLKAIAQRAVVLAASGAGAQLVTALLKSWTF